MNDRFSLKKELISRLIAIIIGCVVVAITVYLIPFADMYDTVVINNVNLTKSAIFSKFILKSSFITIFLFFVTYTIVMSIFKLPIIKNNLKFKEHTKKGKVHFAKKQKTQEKQKIEVENMGNMNNSSTKTIQFKAPILNDYTKFQAAQGEDYIKLYDDDEDLF